MTDAARKLADKLETKLVRSLETNVQPRSVLRGADELALVVAALRRSPQPAVSREEPFGLERSGLRKELRITSDHDYRSWSDIERAILALIPVAPTTEPVADLADAPLDHPIEVMREGTEILVNLMSSIRKHGNYSAGSTITFIDQALQCFRLATPPSAPTTEPVAWRGIAGAITALEHARPIIADLASSSRDPEYKECLEKIKAGLASLLATPPSAQPDVRTATIEECTKAAAKAGEGFNEFSAQRAAINLAITFMRALAAIPPGDVRSGE